MTRWTYDAAHVVQRADERRAQHLCRCGCPRSSHQHYRGGEDCGRCGRKACPSFRRPPRLLGLRVWLRAWVNGQCWNCGDAHPFDGCPEQWKGGVSV